MYLNNSKVSHILKKGYEGSGQGLSAAVQIIIRHSANSSAERMGRLPDDHNPGPGFKIYLPFRK